MSEVYHLVTRGHFGLGLHSDVMSWNDTRGVRYYSLWAVNLTPFPVPVRACVAASDAGMQTYYRDGLQWITDGRPTPRPVWSFPSVCDGLGQPTWSVWWPGASVNLMLGRMLPPRPEGDRLRFVAVTLFDWEDDYWLQFRVVSEEIDLSDYGQAR